MTRIALPRYDLRGPRRSLLTDGTAQGLRVITRPCWGPYGRQLDDQRPRHHRRPSRHRVAQVDQDLVEGRWQLECHFKLLDAVGGGSFPSPQLLERRNVRLQLLQRGVQSRRSRVDFPAGQTIQSRRSCMTAVGPWTVASQVSRRQRRCEVHDCRPRRAARLSLWANGFPAMLCSAWCNFIDSAFPPVHYIPENAMAAIPAPPYIPMAVLRSCDR